jgi:6-phosphogluconolactonase (cycloisomerase 2 family)
MTNRIDSYSIHYNGSLSAPTSTASTGETPFGMDVSPQDPSLLVVCDAGSNGGTDPGTGALTSYTLYNSQVLVKDGPVASQQTATCWVVITANGRFAYTGNTGSNTISAYQIGEDGKLTLLTTVPNNTTSSPATEVVLTHDSRYLYVLDAFMGPGSGTSGLSAFQVQPDGRLVAVSELASITLPSSSSGLTVS